MRYPQFALLLLLPLVSCAPSSPSLRIGCKNFAEQLILGELLAQSLEKTYPRQIVRKFGLGSTGLIHQALVSGDIDLYVEYSGTAAQAILKLRPSPLSTTILQLKQAYRQQFQAEWLEPLGFSNSYAVVLRADQFPHQPRNLTELAPQAPSLRAGLNAEFMQRPDGYPLLSARYGIKFQTIMNLDVGLIYPALNAGQVDVVVAFSTDGRLADPRYRVLPDDQNAFPHYEATPVVRLDALDRFPQLRTQLLALARTLDEKTMRQLNARVEIDHVSPAQVAREYWTNHQSR